MILLMMMLTFADVIGRYLLAAPIFGASEMISALLALAIFSGLGVTNARDEHIVVELFNDQVRDLAPRADDMTVHGFSIAVMALIAFVLCEHAIESYQQNARTKTDRYFQRRNTLHIRPFNRPTVSIFHTKHRNTFTKPCSLG